MSKHLLIPLDGSRLAEAVLPAAASLAATLRASVSLVHVIEKNAPREVHGQQHLTTSSEAQTYLRTVVDAFFPKVASINYHVHAAAVEDVAKSIVEHAGEFDTDLITMCTHGRGGVKQLLWGTIAQQIIALGKTPVLLVQPHPNDKPAAPSFRCILVPLDGTPRHERSLGIAADLAAACGASLRLALVVPTVEVLTGELAPISRMLPGATAHMLDMEAEEAHEYLSSKQADLQRRGIAVTTAVLRGDPAAVIIEAAKQWKADLVVMDTHGKAGMEAFWSGSVAPKVCGESTAPLLLVPAQEDGETTQ